MEKATDKQISFGRNLGLDLSNSSKEVAKIAINNAIEKKSPKDVNTSSGTFKSEQKQYEAKVPSHGNNTSFKVAYAKDLLIAMMEHASATGNKEFDVIAGQQLAIQLVGGMWHVFSDQ